jgi:hypothetical protein
MVNDIRTPPLEMLDMASYMQGKLPNEARLTWPRTSLFLGIKAESDPRAPRRLEVHQDPPMYAHARGLIS